MTHYRVSEKYLGILCVTLWCCILIANLRCFKVYVWSARTLWWPHLNEDGEPPHFAIILFEGDWTNRFLDVRWYCLDTRMAWNKYKTYTPRVMLSCFSVRRRCTSPILNSDGIENRFQDVNTNWIHSEECKMLSLIVWRTWLST